MRARCFLIFGLGLLALSAAAEPELEFKRAGVLVAKKSLTELKREIAPRVVGFHDPHYGKIKRFECLPIAAVMVLVYGENWLNLPETHASFAASDGYASQTGAARLAEKDGCLAFRDLDFPGWEPVGRRQVSPAPFYLFWERPEQSPENGYPWPWQLTAIDLVSFESAYPEVVPRGAKDGSGAWRGYEIFRARCMRCHAVNRQGGTVGPDLNAPMSITKYRSKKWIKSWTRQPSRYRYSQMPDHLDLKDGDLDDLYEYFKWKAKQPETPAF